MTNKMTQAQEERRIEAAEYEAADMINDAMPEETPYPEWATEIMDTGLFEFDHENDCAYAEDGKYTATDGGQDYTGEQMICLEIQSRHNNLFHRVTEEVAAAFMNGLTHSK